MLDKRQRWTLVAGLASVIGVQITEHLLASAWRLTRRKDPPYEPNKNGVKWRSAILWTAGVGALAGLSDLVSRRGAELGWQRVTGEKPPRPRRHVRSKRHALLRG